ncbi:MAG: WYL domain-containing protein, partial [Bacteroidetes bacterium]|nr:WYL domain-containing protein [Bacteroidota bacterium]
KYFISDEGESDINDRMLEAFDVFNFLNMAKDLSQHIYFEKHKLTGAENVHGFLHAIKNRIVIQFNHGKFLEDKLTHRTVEPLALKESQHRWYLLANDRKDDRIKTFGIDRISKLEFTRQQFDYPKNLDVNEMFRYSFGVITSTDKPEEIILSFDTEQGKYIKSLPLHESQTVLIDNEEELRIKLTLYITQDLIMTLLSYGDQLQVISPEILRKTICKIYSSSLKMYQKKVE